MLMPKFLDSFPNPREDPLLFHSLFICRQVFDLFWSILFGFPARIFAQIQQIKQLLNLFFRRFTPGLGRQRDVTHTIGGYPIYLISLPTTFRTGCLLPQGHVSRINDRRQ